MPSRDGRRCNQQEQHKTTFCQQADGESEHEFTRIIREFKDNNIYPQINTDGHGCPQADGGGEQQLSAIGQQLKEIFLLIAGTLLEIAVQTKRNTC